MFRPLHAVVAAGLLSGVSIAQESSLQPAPRSAPVTSTVFSAFSPAAIQQFQENPAATRRMVDQLVLACTGQKEIGAAWRSLVTPKDRVGIKVSAVGAPYFSTHRGVVEAILDGLEQAGIPRGEIVVWDRDAALLREAGFEAKKGGYQLHSVEPIHGYDREATLAAPVLGKLIWGDALFQRKKPLPLGAGPVEVDQLSSTSHLASVLSRGVTKVINVPVLRDEATCGIAGALYNMTVPNLDNWRRFLQPSYGAADGIADAYADERIGAKVVLHIMDGLLAQYAAGPAADPNYAFAHATLYASKDPVALDATALRLIEGWRKQAKLPPIGRRGEWLRTAAELGLGNFAEEKIVLRQVSAASP